MEDSAALAHPGGAWGGLVVRVDASSGQRPVDNAAVSLAGTMIGAYTDSAGVASIRAPAGAYRLLVRRVGYARYETPVNLRAGYLDSVSLGIGTGPRCLVEMSTTSVQ